MSLKGLNFESREAACWSLRVLAEHVRTGQLSIRLTDIRPDAGLGRIDFETPVRERTIRRSSKS